MSGLHVYSHFPDHDLLGLGIRANPSVGTIGFSGGINSAILRYVGADEVDPDTVSITATAALVENDLVVCA